MYWFSIAIVTNPHIQWLKKNTNVIILQFWMPELFGAKIKVSTSLVPPGGARGEFVSLTFPASRDLRRFLKFWLLVSNT